MKTEGVSPKVKVPSIVLGIVGVVLVIASYVIDGLEDLQSIGWTLIAASPIGALLGYNAAPGEVHFEGNLPGGVTDEQYNATTTEEKGA